MSDNFDINSRIDDFKKRMETELEFCEALFQCMTIRLLAAKYAYYVKSSPFMEDMAYDFAEKCWYIMGRALGHLKEDEISQCIDFDDNHLFAPEAIKEANKLMRSKGLKK